MFKLTNKYTVDTRFVKCDYFRCSPKWLSVVNVENKQMFIDTPREDSAISLRHSYLELEFAVEHKAAGNNSYIDDEHRISKFRSDCSI